MLQGVAAIFYKSAARAEMKRKATDPGTQKTPNWLPSTSRIEPWPVVRRICFATQSESSGQFTVARLMAELTDCVAFISGGSKGLPSSGTGTKFREPTVVHRGSGQARL